MKIPTNPYTTTTTLTNIILQVNKHILKKQNASNTQTVAEIKFGDTIEAPKTKSMKNS